MGVDDFLAAVGVVNQHTAGHLLHKPEVFPCRLKRLSLQQGMQALGSVPVQQIPDIQVTVLKGAQQFRDMTHQMVVPIPIPHSALLI